MSPDPFFERRKEWSKYKHQILEKYVRIWVYKLSHGYRELAFVDTCAGEGRYDDGAVGSPLLAAQWNDEFLSANDRGRLVVYACEAVPETAAKLRIALKPYLALRPPCAVVYEQQYFEAMPAILAAVRGKPTLFFIDPYGLKDMVVEHVSPILAGRKGTSTEVLARIDPGLMARFTGWLRKRDRSATQEKTAKSFQRLLERLNVDTQQLIDAMEEDPAEPPDQMQLLASYLNLFWARFKYVQVIPIRPQYPAAPKYFLIHGTDSSHGAAFLNDAVSTTEDSLYEDTVKAKDRKRGQVSIFDHIAEPPREPRYPLDALDRAIVSTLVSEGRSMKFIDLRAELAALFGPDFREMHHKAAVRRLVKCGALSSLVASNLSEGTMLTLSDATSNPQVLPSSN
ncbi:MAG: three-Cys-motif partner protein TcmP [Gemmatimonadota bacterium]